ncbi:hypothetical protein LEP1GSC199_1598 [Leptospira vanthielii serovar Holland str. Waz Holland = ATCC 700522]|uniref:Uncharacterized protein n=1 Tax=Leptospira vanthielii serovar Holland str. Waz Holland = ATCC 700522 TaxID=1218591 RepID=N1W9C2_9LEPT|nr:hypothetical protein LEP1GSC199_1598 [Leptospira vanthielii serovar Holland str. Waz Holland = ATCC 700522]
MLSGKYVLKKCHVARYNAKASVKIFFILDVKLAKLRVTN